MTSTCEEDETMPDVHKYSMRDLNTFTASEAPVKLADLDLLMVKYSNDLHLLG